MKDSGIEWIGEIPCDWKLERSQWHLEEVNISNNPVQTNNVLSLTNKLGVVPYEEKGNQGNKSKENVYEYKLAYPNTIVANSMNILIGSVGLCDYFGCVSPVYYVFRAKKYNNIKFLNYVFQTVGFQRELRKYANGILEIRLRVSSSDILKRFIPFPSEIEQQRIAEFLDRECGKIDGLKADIQAQIDTLEQYKRSVITEVVTHGLNPSAPMKDSRISWVGDIPQNWKIKRLKYLFKFCKGLPITKDNLIDQGLPVISYGQIHAKTNNGVNVRPHLLRFVDFSYQTFYPLSQVMRGDFVFADTSEDYEGCGNCVYKRNDSLLFAGYHTIIAHSIVESDNRFFAYLFLTDIWRKQIREKVSGVKVFSITQKTLSNTYLILPPLEEQQEIADYLDNKCAEIEQIIADKKSQIETLDGYKKSLIFEYVTGKKEIAL